MMYLDFYSFLGPDKAVGVLGWHALYGCDTTGRFAGRGKTTWWSLFMSLDCDEDKDINSAFNDFGDNCHAILASTEKRLSRFVTLD